MTRPRDYDLPQDLALTVRPVGVMRSPQRFHHDAPRQAGDAGPDGAIVIRQGLQNLLKDLGGFSHLWVLFWCHWAHGWNDQVVPPRDRCKRGLLATRAPHRPNPIGLSVLRLLRIERRVLHVGPHDLLDGSPILDIKPYIKAYDAIAGASDGWVETLPYGGKDHRAWWEDEGKPRPTAFDLPPLDPWAPGGGGRRGS